MSCKPAAARHQKQCSICRHAQREEIEQEFASWGSTAAMAKTYKVSRDALYRHAHAVGLMKSRSSNVRLALEKIIERAGEVEVNAGAVVSAVVAYARINARGQLVDRSESVDLTKLFERMSAQELEQYAKDGTLPGWFRQTVGATD